MLIVEDDAQVGEALARALKAEAEVEIIRDSRLALQRLKDGERWDVVLCDLMMPDLSGMEMYGEAVKRAPDAAASFVFMTGGAFTPRARAFVESIADRCLEKPIDIERRGKTCFGLSETSRPSGTILRRPPVTASKCCG